jgi:hypothetical protein
MNDSRISAEDRKALAELAKNDRAAFAEVVTEYIDPTYLTLDLAGQFMNTREMTFGDILVKRFKGKYHVQQIVPGQITLGEQITVRDKALGWNLDILAAKASYNELELRNGGPQFTPETVRSDVRKALEEQIVMRSWNALANIWTTGNAAALTMTGAANSNWLSASGILTSTALDAAIDHVNYWAGSVRTIIGTETALAPLSTFGQYQMIGTGTQYNDAEPWATNGQPSGTFQNVSPYGPGSKAVETYRGVTNIVRLKQIFDETEYPKRALLPNDFVLVIGDNIGEFITYGGPQTKEWTDMEPTPPYWNFEIWQQFGMMIWNAQGLVKIAVTPAAIP